MSKPFFQDNVIDCDVGDRGGAWVRAVTLSSVNTTVLDNILAWHHCRLQKRLLCSSAIQSVTECVCGGGG